MWLVTDFHVIDSEHLDKKKKKLCEVISGQYMYQYDAANFVHKGVVFVGYNQYKNVQVSRWTYPRTFLQDGRSEIPNGPRPLQIFWVNLHMQ